MTEPGPILQTEDIYAEAIRSLADVQHVMTSPMDVPIETAEAAGLAFGWWVRIVRSADAVRRLHADGLAGEASPLVRTVLLHWVALAWLCRYPTEAVEAVKFENARWKQKFVNKAAASTPWKRRRVKLGPPPKDAPEGWLYLNEPEKLCKRTGTPDTYLPYMLESPYSHPSLTSSQAYVRLGYGQVTLHDESQAPLVSLRIVANAAALATKLFGDFIGDVAMSAKAVAVAHKANLPLAFGDAAPAPVEPES